MTSSLEDAIEKLTLADEQPADNNNTESTPLTVELLAEQIKSGSHRRIIVMTGAGTSTAAGIPDFRSPKTGLYSNLQKYELPYAEAIFDIDYFHERPEPFFTLAKELYPGRFQPTLTHFFIRLLADKGLLLRLYTQNIDMLERLAGIDDELLVEAHGSFHSARCVERKCNEQYHHKEIQERIFADEIPRCDRCGSLVKPEIVFFGESLPDKFFHHLAEDFDQCDLLIVIGTSLTVHPFASLITKPRPTVPRLLINMERCGETMRNGFDFEGRKDRDLALLGECDSGCKQLARLLGWEESLTELMDSALSALTGINLVESVENVAEAAEDVETADESGNDCSDDGQSAGEEAEFRHPVYAAESVATGNDVPAHSGVISSNSSDEDSI